MLSLYRSDHHSVVCMHVVQVARCLCDKSFHRSYWRVLFSSHKSVALAVYSYYMSLVLVNLQLLVSASQMSNIVAEDSCHISRISMGLVNTVVEVHFRDISSAVCRCLWCWKHKQYQFFLCSCMSLVWAVFFIAHRCLSL
jgi:hypothetical protein